MPKSNTYFIYPAISAFPAFFSTFVLYLINLLFQTVGSHESH